MHNTRRKKTSRAKKRTITYNGETLSIAEWAKKLGRAESTLTSRYESNWTAKEIIETPVKKARVPVTNRTSKAKPVIGICLETGEEKRWRSTKQASQEIKVHPAIIRQCCRGEREQSKGWAYRYVNEG